MFSAFLEIRPNIRPNECIKCTRSIHDLFHKIKKGQPTSDSFGMASDGLQCSRFLPKLCWRGFSSRKTSDQTTRKAKTYVTSNTYASSGTHFIRREIRRIRGFLAYHPTSYPVAWPGSVAGGRAQVARPETWFYTRFTARAFAPHPSLSHQVVARGHSNAGSDAWLGRQDR
jgi:hypothetical protein